MENMIEFSKNVFTSLAQYGTEMIPSANLALLRGSGLYNPGPKYEQTTYRGPAYDQAYFLYKDKDNEEADDTGDTGDTEAPINQMDYDRTIPYTVGSTSFHPEPTGSWNRSDFEGSRGTDMYQVFAINSLKTVPTPLLNFFFSADNVDHIQDTIVSEVKRIKNIDIQRQSVDELLIIMRNFYEYGLSGFLPLSNQKAGAFYPSATVPGEINPETGKRSAYWNLGDDSGSGMSLEFQISQLNQAVVNECVKQVLSGIDAYKQYYRDASSIPMPLDRPVLTYTKGANVLQENLGFHSSHEFNRDITSYSQRYNIF